MLDFAMTTASRSMPGLFPQKTAAHTAAPNLEQVSAAYLDPADVPCPGF